MEELFNKFAQHIAFLVSAKLGHKIQNYLNTKFLKSKEFTVSQDDNDEVEHEIKSALANYFKNATDQDYLDIATHLFNSYIETDDANIIKSVKTFVGMYSHFQENKLKKLFYQWRINILYEDDHQQQKKEQENPMQSVRTNTQIHYQVSNVQNKNQSTQRKNVKIQDGQLNSKRIISDDTQLEKDSVDTIESCMLKKNMIENSQEIFNKLYMDALKKQDAKILNDEIKRLTDLEQCTFQPNYRAGKQK